MSVLLINPPHSNITSVPLGVAALAGYLREKNIPTACFDLGLEATYFLLQNEQLEKCRNTALHKLRLLEALPSLNYAQQREYRSLLSAWLTLKHLGTQVEMAMQSEKEEDSFSQSRERTRAHYIINKVLEACACVAGDEHLNAGDYRSLQSPFSLNEIADALRQAEKNVFSPFLSDWAKRFSFERVTIVGISIAYAKQIIPALILLQEIKKYCDSCWFVAGGSLLAHMDRKHISSLAAFFDAIIVGEGEEALEALAVERGGGSKKPSTKPLIDPWSGDDGSAMPCLYRAPKPVPPDFSDFLLERYMLPAPVLPLQTNRKCYWGKCVFCCLHASFKQQDWCRTPEEIVDDMAALAIRHRVKRFELVDDAIAPEYLKQMSQLIVERGLDVQWFCYARLDPSFTEEILFLMKQAGCVALKFGLESASPTVLKRMNKGTQLDEAHRIIRQTRNVGITAQLAFFACFPGETRADIALTVDFVKKHLGEGCIMAFNGIFRCLESMPLWSSPQTFNVEKFRKWNTDESLINYFIPELIDGMTWEEFLPELQTLTSGLISAIQYDVPRSVDLRRLYFYPTEPIALAGENHGFARRPRWPVSSTFNVKDITVYSDINHGDFLPGAGIYATRSHVMANAHDPVSLNSLNRYVPPLRNGEVRYFFYDPIADDFTEQRESTA